MSSNKHAYTYRTPVASVRNVNNIIRGSVANAIIAIIWSLIMMLAISEPKSIQWAPWVAYPSILLLFFLSLPSITRKTYDVVGETDSVIKWNPTIEVLIVLATFLLYTITLYMFWLTEIYVMVIGLGTMTVMVLVLNGLALLERHRDIKEANEKLFEVSLMKFGEKYDI